MKLEEQLALTRLLLCYAAINFQAVMAHPNGWYAATALNEAIYLMNAAEDFEATVKDAFIV